MKHIQATLVIAALTSSALLNVQAAPINIDSPNTSYTQDFNSLAASDYNKTATTLPAGWSFSESGSGKYVDGAYRIGDGAKNTADTYSFGAKGSTDRALGTLRSGSLASTIGVEFRNATATTLSSLEISYVGEQWRLGTANRGPDRLNFEFSLDASSLTDGSWTSVSALDFLSPDTSASSKALNGNAPANETTLSATAGNLTIAPDATFWLRWTDQDADGADDGLAIDDFSLTAQAPSRSVPDALPFGTGALALIGLIGMSRRLHNAG